MDSNCRLYAVDVLSGVKTLLSDKSSDGETYPKLLISSKDGTLFAVIKITNGRIGRKVYCYDKDTKQAIWSFSPIYQTLFVKTMKDSFAFQSAEWYSPTPYDYAYFVDKSTGALKNASMYNDGYFGFHDIKYSPNKNFVLLHINGGQLSLKIPVER